MLRRLCRHAVVVIVPSMLMFGLAAFAPGSVATSQALRFHPLVSPAGVHLATVQSNNWSGYDEGYMDTNTLAHSITGQWVVPTATQHTANEAESAANWIGIGGGCIDMKNGCSATDSTLIQAGTEEDVSANGQASYSAWWEVIPAPSVTASITVNPGDTVRVTISGPGLWKISVQDLTDGQGFSQSIGYSSSELTAEWVEEAPVVVSTSGGAGEAALPNLSVPDFDLGTLNGANPGFVPAYEMQMVSTTGSVLATPSAPDSDVDGFNVCTYAASCTASSS